MRVADTLGNTNFVMKFKKTFRKVVFIIFIRKLKVCGLEVHSDLEIRLVSMLSFNQILFSHVKEISSDVKFQKCISNFQAKFLEAVTKVHVTNPLRRVTSHLLSSFNLLCNSNIASIIAHMQLTL